MDYSPTVRARRLIREIVRLRTDSGLSMDTVASRLDWSKSKLYRIEAGRTRISTDDLEDVLDLYGTAATSHRRSTWSWTRQRCAARWAARRPSGSSSPPWQTSPSGLM